MGNSDKLEITYNPKVETLSSRQDFLNLGRRPAGQNCCEPQDHASHFESGREHVISKLRHPSHDENEFRFQPYGKSSTARDLHSQSFETIPYNGKSHCKADLMKDASAAHPSDSVLVAAMLLSHVKNQISASELQATAASLSMRKTSPVGEIC